MQDSTLVHEITMTDKMDAGRWKSFLGIDLNDETWTTANPAGSSKGFIPYIINNEIKTYVIMFMTLISL